jgi:hypothetical protein
MPSKVITEEPHRPLRNIVKLLLIGGGVGVGLATWSSASNAAKRADHSYVAQTVEGSCAAGFTDAGEPAVAGTLVTGEARISCDTMPASLSFAAFMQFRATSSAPWAKVGAPDTLPSLPSKTNAYVYLHPQTPNRPSPRIFRPPGGRARSQTKHFRSRRA